jgi:predicted DNA repair protein MutK
LAVRSLLTMLDDIAAVLDDVAVMTKVATRKTAGVLGDDLALNAQQVAGVRADRELPVVWAVAKGSALNKVILVPVALVISFFAPWAVVPLLMLGGLFLCFEGVEKLVHRAPRASDPAVAAPAPEPDPAALERLKVKGAIRTDFILSAEIIVISLGTVAAASFGKQLAVLTGISVIMTVGVYGLVAGIVKLDDGGLYLAARQGKHALAKAQRALGRGLLWLAPWLMKLLSVAGTAAMFMVGGGILTHGLPGAHDLIHHLAAGAATAPVVGGLLQAVLPTVLDAVAGILAGAAAVIVFEGVKRLVRRLRPGPARPAGV